MFLSEPPLSGEVSELYEKDKSQDGYVANLTKLWAWRPDVHVAFMELRAKLMSASTLSKRELAVLVCATASTLKDSYCSIAWGARLASQSDASTAAGVLKGIDGNLDHRERALARWARKVVSAPNETTADEVKALRAAGLGDKEILEATAFIALRLAFSTVNDALGAQPDAPLAAQSPTEVREAVNYGRRVAQPA